MKEIYILWWAGCFMGWSEDEKELHEWVKDLDSTWEGENGEEGTDYVIQKVPYGFNPDTEETEHELIIKPGS